MLAGVAIGLQVYILARFTISSMYFRWERNILLLVQVITMPKKYDNGPRLVMSNSFYKALMRQVFNTGEELIKMMSSTYKSMYLISVPSL